VVFSCIELSQTHQKILNSIEAICEDKNTEHFRERNNRNLFRIFWC
jgi:hypothetical protein